MFTGIVQAIGLLQRSEAKSGDRRLTIQCSALDLSDVALGDSIAANGVCLTVTELTHDGFLADLSRETLKSTTFGHLEQGSRLNLEKALTLRARLGGHLVSGHVDGVGLLLEKQTDARSIQFVIEAPTQLARYIAHKGSICVDGVSLTVNGVNGSRFELNLVPHTLQKTIMDDYQIGMEVNLEVDLIARYLERLILGKETVETSTQGVTAALLKAHGFIRY
jgi:riboflavin synthase